MYHSRDATGPERNHDSGGLARTNAMKAAGHDDASDKYSGAAATEYYRNTPKMIATTAMGGRGYKLDTRLFLNRYARDAMRRRSIRGVGMNKTSPFRL
jgi:hypothetical protein